MDGNLTSVLTVPGELREFLDGWENASGLDPSDVVCQVFVPWHPDIAQLCDVRPNYDYQERVLLLVFSHASVTVTVPVPISEDLEPSIICGEIQAYGLRKVCLGVWALAPSLLVPGLVHCYVVFHGVPEPAPWESQIIVVSALEMNQVLRCLST